MMKHDLIHKTSLCNNHEISSWLHQSLFLVLGLGLVLDCDPIKASKIKLNVLNNKAAFGVYIMLSL